MTKLRLEVGYEDNEPVHFVDYFPKKCFFKVVRFGKPKSGEYFLSGAIPEAYHNKTVADMTVDYWIVEPTHLARQEHYYSRIPLKG